MSPAWRAVRTTEVSQGDEGPNAGNVLNSLRRFTDLESASLDLRGAEGNLLILANRRIPDRYVRWCVRAEVGNDRSGEPHLCLLGRSKCQFLLFPTRLPAGICSLKFIKSSHYIIEFNRIMNPRYMTTVTDFI